MNTMGKLKKLAVNRCGALAGSILRGAGPSNHGLRLRILQEQERGHDGAIHGRFVILETGENIHALTLQPLVDQETDAEEVLQLIRSERPGCVNVVNANRLIVEPSEAGVLLGSAAAG
jgi:hypothetical protein